MKTTPPPFATNLAGLEAQRDEVVAAMIRRDKQPAFVQAQFGNALEARFKTIQGLIFDITHQHYFENHVCVICDETFANAVRETVERLAA